MLWEQVQAGKRPHLGPEAPGLTLRAAPALRLHLHPCGPGLQAPPCLGQLETTLTSQAVSLVWAWGQGAGCGEWPAGVLCGARGWEGKAGQEPMEKGRARGKGGLSWSHGGELEESWRRVCGILNRRIWGSSDFFFMVREQQVQAWQLVRSRDSEEWEGVRGLVSGLSVAVGAGGALSRDTGGLSLRRPLPLLLNCSLQSLLCLHWQHTLPAPECLALRDTWEGTPFHMVESSSLS